MDLYDADEHRLNAFTYGLDPRVGAAYELGLVLWVLGYPDQALARSRQAIALAEELGHALSLAPALFFAAMLHQFRREGQEAHEMARRGSRGVAVGDLAVEEGNPYWRAWSSIIRGWALAALGQPTEGIEQIRDGLRDIAATGDRSGRAHGLALFAEALQRVGRLEDGLAALAEASDLAVKSGNHLFEAEIHRIQGEILLQLADRDPSEAEACFHKAIDVARRQSAKSWELRASMSLARLWEQQGKKAEARQMLAEIYGWFTEGFDTADLRDAKALLDSLEN